MNIHIYCLTTKQKKLKHYLSPNCNLLCFSICQFTISRLQLVQNVSASSVSITCWRFRQGDWWDFKKHLKSYFYCLSLNFLTLFIMFLFWSSSTFHNISSVPSVVCYDAPCSRIHPHPVPGVHCSVVFPLNERAHVMVSRLSVDCDMLTHAAFTLEDLLLLVGPLGPTKPLSLKARLDAPPTLCRGHCDWVY